MRVVLGGGVDRRRCSSAFPVALLLLMLRSLRIVGSGCD